MATALACRRTHSARSKMILSMNIRLKELTAAGRLAYLDLSLAQLNSSFFYLLIVYAKFIFVLFTNCSIYFFSLSKFRMDNSLKVFCRKGFALKV
jgi:hypothetical protein